VRTSSAVDRIVVYGDRAVGLEADGSFLPFDSILSTVPIPHASRLLQDLEGEYFDNLRSLQYIGVMVMTMHVNRPLTEYFWINVNDSITDISGIIEYSNLNRDLGLDGGSIVYIPQYLPSTDQRYSVPDEELFQSYVEFLTSINPEFDRSWVKEYWIHRDRFAQPICQIGFSRYIPNIQTPVENLFLTDSYQLHPHDRSISDSTNLGSTAAGLILAAQSQGVVTPVAV
jgi:protoporphyrinogen oxidase